jgi:hypothetical protein
MIIVLLNLIFPDFLMPPMPTRGHAVNAQGVCELRYMRNLQKGVKIRKLKRINRRSTHVYMKFTTESGPETREKWLE